MSTVEAFLAGPLAIVPSNAMSARLGRDIPDAITLASELTSLSQGAGLPARIAGRRRQPTIAVYTRVWVLWLGLTGEGDAFRLTDAAPRRLSDQAALVTGALLLRSSAPWWVLPSVADVARLRSERGYQFQTSWPELTAKWQAATAPSPVATADPAHTRFLDVLTSVVEAGREIETRRLRDADPVPYKNREPTREPRFSAKGVYDFTVTRQSGFGRGTQVYIAEHTTLRGRVVQVRNFTLTVRFESAVGYGAIPPQGGLLELPSRRVYDKQLDAIAKVRAGRAANGWLLSLFVDHHVMVYRPATDERPRGTPDNEQLKVFRRALTVPDALLVLGPPGTGKTWTIGEIISSLAARGQQVLLTSHTNRAVDNVLERLSPHLRVVRVGNEDALTSGARAYLADVQVERLQERILGATDGTAGRLAMATGAESDRWSQYLHDQLAASAAAEGSFRDAEEELARAVARVSAPTEERKAAAAATLAAHESALDLAAGAAESISARLGRPGILDRLLAGPLRRRQERAVQNAAAARAALPRARSELATAEGALRVLLSTDPEIDRLRRTSADARRLLDETVQRIAQAAGGLRATLAAALPAHRVALPPSGPADDLDSRRREAVELDRVADLLRRRARLLAQWRERVPKGGASLQRELVKYADVVAATCIGTASTDLLAELRFDVAIVDEAGQISLPNLLVPLVRAKRAVLVGDHRQLPPYLDEEIRVWATSAPKESGQILDLLSKSGFEMLYGRVDDEHREMLRLQRRMPIELASFVSRTFYNNRLSTEHPGGGGDPIFRSPFAMVSTSDVPEADRAETRPPRAPGYLNRLEAELIVDLVARFRHWYPDWAVILPYRAQVDLVRRRLSAALGDPDGIVDRVGTVDSFQGGERDLVVFGFVRSNTVGGVGFLEELRRLNVAISRARRQLVLIGDADFLQRAGTGEFRDVMRAMIAHLRHTGDLRTSTSFRTAIAP